MLSTAYSRLTDPGKALIIRWVLQVAKRASKLFDDGAARFATCQLSAARVAELIASTEPPRTVAVTVTLVLM
eukprot:SAG11_NODE_767_length_7273_cov_3.106914_2_plen_72_part_00